MTDAKLLAELMLQLSIYFESDCDDVAVWLTTMNPAFGIYRPLTLIKCGDIEKVYEFVMENMV